VTVAAAVGRCRSSPVAIGADATVVGGAVDPASSRICCPAWGYNAQGAARSPIARQILMPNFARFVAAHMESRCGSVFRVADNQRGGRLASNVQPAQSAYLTNLATLSTWCHHVQEFFQCNDARRSAPPAYVAALHGAAWVPPEVAASPLRGYTFGPNR
jgi:hypothetical protein